MHTHAQIQAYTRTNTCIHMHQYMHICIHTMSEVLYSYSWRGGISMRLNWLIWKKWQKILKPSKGFGRPPPTWWWRDASRESWFLFPSARGHVCIHTCAYWYMQADTNMKVDTHTLSHRHTLSLTDSRHNIRTTLPWRSLPDFPWPCASCLRSDFGLDWDDSNTRAVCSSWQTWCLMRKIPLVHILFWSLCAALAPPECAQNVLVESFYESSAECKLFYFISNAQA